MTVRTLWMCFVLVPALACATGTRPDDAEDDDIGDDDPATPDAGFVDAIAPPHPIDASPDAPSAPSDAATTGQTCTDDSQCNLGAHECCWKFLIISGVCTYGNVVPIFGCVPADPPTDAGM